MAKKFVWIFIVSIAVFLACTYFVTRKVEVTASSPQSIEQPKQEHDRAVHRPPELPKSIARPESGGGARPATPSPPSAGTGGTSAVAVIQALSGLIAAISGLLAAINSFRRKSPAA
ncbi:MAG: hypothetical protein WBF89_20320 [Steroidobacteraceae bacterium]